MLAASRQQSEPIALPVLTDYDVSPLTGFVPYPQPLARLTRPYYQPWEEIMDQLNHLINSRQLRSRVDQVKQKSWTLFLPPKTILQLYAFFFSFFSFFL